MSYPLLSFLQDSHPLHELLACPSNQCNPVEPGHPQPYQTCCSIQIMLFVLLKDGKVPIRASRSPTISNSPVVKNKYRILLLPTEILDLWFPGERCTIQPRKFGLHVALGKLRIGSIPHNKENFFWAIAMLLVIKRVTLQFFILVSDLCHWAKAFSNER